MLRGWRQGTLVHCWGIYIKLQPLWKTVRRFLKNLKIVLPYDLAIALPGIYLKKKKTLIQKEADSQCS